MFNFIYEGIGWLLGQIYNFTNHYGLSIILLTIIIKVLLIPLTQAQTKSQKSMNEIQPKIQEINKKYKNDKEKQTEETLKLYKEYNVNPMAGCLPMLIQFPIIIALFGVLRDPLKYVFNNDSSLATQATTQAFLWIKDFSVPDTMAAFFSNLSWADKLPGILPILAAILTYLQFKTMSNKTQASSSGAAGGMMKNMQVIFPLMILYFGVNMAAGVTLYWVISTGFQIVQQMIMQSNSTAKEA